MKPLPLSALRPALFSTILPTLLLTACASSRGFDRGALSQMVRPQTPEVTDEAIAKTLAVRPQLTPPFRLAVYFRSGRKLGDTGEDYGTQPWTGADKDAVLSKLSPLVGGGVLSQLIPVADAIVGGEDLKSIRLAAARTGADAVLFVSGAGQVDRYNNWSSALYFTIVGLFVVPGTRTDALYLANATLWDVRNEYLYASAEAEGTDHTTGTPLTVDDTQVLASARLKGMGALGEEVEKRLRNLVPAPAPAPTR